MPGDVEEYFPIGGILVKSQVVNIKDDLLMLFIFLGWSKTGYENFKANELRDFLYHEN